MSHPCLTCGACCSHFRVSFYWTETQPDSFQVPEDKTVKVNDFYMAMRGTEKVQPRCEQLTGVVGKQSSCAIYKNRPSPCRDFTASYEYGQSNPDCDRARQVFGLPPLSLEDWKIQK